MPALRPKSLCACLALVVTTSVVAYLPRPPSTGYSVEAGDHVFVMLTTGCVDEWAEIIVTPPVLAALRAQEVRIQNAQEAYIQRMRTALSGLEIPVTPFPYLENCDRVSLMFPSLRVIEEVEGLEEIDGLVRIRTSSYKKRYMRDVKSSTGQEYPVPGMYRNDGTVTPLWTVDWYTVDRNLNVSRDGNHVVRMIDQPDSKENVVIEFYRQGNLFKRYTTLDLVRGHDDDRYEAGLTWISTELDEDRFTLRAKTDHHALLVFNFKNGELTTRYVGKDGHEKFSVTLLSRDGGRIELSDFQMCGPPSFESSLITDDTPTNRYLYGMRSEHVRWLTVGDKTGAIGYEPPDGMGYFAIPFSRIRGFHPIAGPDIMIAPTTIAWDPRRWMVTEIDGTQHSMLIDSRYLSYCGKGPDGQIQAVRHRDTAGITFHASH